MVGRRPSRTPANATMTVKNTTALLVTVNLNCEFWQYDYFGSFGISRIDIIASEKVYVKFFQIVNVLEVKNAS